MELARLSWPGLTVGIENFNESPIFFGIVQKTTAPYVKIAIGMN